MRLSRLVGAIAAIVALTGFGVSAIAQDPRQEPIADLAGQIAAILGHDSARLMIRNMSSLPVDEIPAIRKQLELDLSSHGIVANGAPNDNVIRVTLSESARGYTWVAEVIRGDETEVAVVDLPAAQSSQMSGPVQFMLRRELLISASQPVLNALELDGAMVVATPAEIDVETHSQAGWTKSQTAPIAARLPLARDPRGIILPAPQGAGFEAWLMGSHCTGSPAQTPAGGFTVDCHGSEDPWPLAQMVEQVTPSSSPTPNPPPPGQTASPPPQFRAFYNATRNYFTGVVSPDMGVDLPPFYSAAVLKRITGTALLIGGIDGKILLTANGKLTAVTGTSDWGSDFALIHSGCGGGAQIIASGAGNSIPGNPSTDSLRAYEIAGSNAEPRSAPLTIDGTVTAVWSAQDGKSVLVVIRNAQNQYEVDRVTALCD